MASTIGVDTQNAEQRNTKTVKRLQVLVSGAVNRILPSILQ